MASFEMVQRDYMNVKGLLYLENFLTEKQQQDALDEVEERRWLTDLRRRVQHYGYKYDYRNRSIDEFMRTEPLPEFAWKIGEWLLDAELISESPDQMIVNEYMPGQGIAAHIDCVPCFKDEIATVSLGSTYEMELFHQGRGVTKTLDLIPGSCLVFTDSARYNWRHCIQPRKFDGDRKRGRRVSLTFRRVILKES